MFRSFKTLSWLISALTVSLLVAGCSAVKSAPTPSLQELQLTAQASAAQTLTAQAPSPTTIPPTPIPPTPTLEPIIVAAPTSVVAPQELPSVEQPVVIVPAATEAGTKELDCSGAINAGTEGGRAPVQIINKKGASILFSYYLEPNAFGQCGSGSVNIEDESESLNLPQGCYFLYAWVTHKGREQSFQGYGCNPPKGATWVIYPDRMEAVEP